MSRFAWGQMIDGSKHFPVHAGQSKILRSKARFTAAIAGTGGGKTVIGPLWILDRLAEVWDVPGRDYSMDPILAMVVAPTYKIMERATAPTFVRTLAGTIFEGNWTPSRGWYDLPDGKGRIYFVSADNPGSLEGGQLDFAWIDEGGQLKYDAWVALQGRTGLKRAPILITTTPYAKNWLFHSFYNKWKTGDRDYFVHQWWSHDNPAYSKEEVERARRSMSTVRHRMRYGGEFGKMEGLVYPDLSSCRVPADTVVPGGRHFGGIDFGWNDPFAALAGTHFVHEDGRDIIFVWYERYKRMEVIRKHAAALPRVGARFFADPSRPDSIAELRKADIIVNPNKVKGIDVGVDAVNERIYTQRLWISEACVACFAEAEMYRYDIEEDAEDNPGEKPVDFANHAMDALRYLVVGVDRGQIARKKPHRSLEEVEADMRELDKNLHNEEKRHAADRTDLEYAGA